MTDLNIGYALLEIGAVGFVPHAPVTFKSGIVSPVYVDNRRLPFHPLQWRIIIEGFVAHIRAAGLTFDVIAGVAVGGVPHSAALAYSLETPSVFIRQEAKGHGHKKLVEGGDVTGKRVLLIEDLVTTGGSSMVGINALRAEGAVAEDILAIVSYGFTEATTALDAAGARLHTLTNFSAILDAADALGLFSQDERSIIDDWFNDPHGWAERHNLT